MAKLCLRCKGTGKVEWIDFIMGRNKKIPFPEGHISFKYNDTNKDKRDVARSILKYHFEINEMEDECPKCLGTGVIEERRKKNAWKR